MKPYSAVHALFVYDSEKKRYGFGGSCFRLWSDNHFLTACHCVHGLPADAVAVLNYLAEDNGEEELMRCVTVCEHPTADLAVIEVKGRVPDLFQKFKLTDKDYDLGTPVHCFGMLDEWMASHDAESGPGRVIAGILQRDFVWRDGPFVSPVLEYSAPIPTGMSGGPAFYAHRPDTVLGMAIGTITSTVVVSQWTDYKDDKIHEMEKISEVTRYGVILGLFQYREWLRGILPGEGK